MPRRQVLLAMALLAAYGGEVFVQSVSHRGFVQGSALFFPQEAPNNPTRSVGDLLVREAAFFSSPSPATDEYVLYVVQLERQTGEWVLVGGYAGEAVTERRSGLTFAPDRGTSRAFVARASYTVDPNRSVAVEGAARQNGDGVYAKAEYSQASGQHWRTTVMAVAIGGRRNDFLGQYRRNSHVALTLRYSF